MISENAHREHVSSIIVTNAAYAPMNCVPKGFVFLCCPWNGHLGTVGNGMQGCYTLSTTSLDGFVWQFRFNSEAVRCSPGSGRKDIAEQQPGISVQSQIA